MTRIQHLTGFVLLQDSKILQYRLCFRNMRLCQTVFMPLFRSSKCLLLATAAMLVTATSVSQALCV